MKTEQGITCIFGVNLRIFLLKTYFEGMIYVPTTNVQAIMSPQPRGGGHIGFGAYPVGGVGVAFVSAL